MKIFLKLSIVIFLFSAFACEKETEETNTELKGYWINETYDEGVSTFQRASELKKDAYGIAFKVDGKMVQRANAGWCGTPPVTFVDYDGEWTLSGTELLFTVGYWGGKYNQKWEIISVDSKKLVVKYIPQEQEN